MNRGAASATVFYLLPFFTPIFAPNLQKGMSILDQFKQVKTFVFDVDGVLTDGSLLILDNGQFMRTMDIKDGYAIALAVKKGYRIAVISGSTSDAVIKRLSHLGVTDVYMNVKDKKKQLAE